MESIMRQLVAGFCALALTASIGLSATVTMRTDAAGVPDRPHVSDEKDKAVLGEFREHARREAAKLTAEHFQQKEEPEMLCWVELKQMRMSLVAYELTGEVDHLRDFARALENLRSALRRGPDGFLGWRGKPIEPLRDPAKPDVEIDEIQTSFRAVGVLSHFVEIVDGEDRLKREFGHLREPLVDLMESHLVKKWDARGRWVDLGPVGGVYRWNAAYVPKKAGLSLPWEKLSIAVDGLLRLCRVTGNDEYMRKAIKLGTRMKRCMQLQDGRYLWYNWVPAGEWDVHPDDPNKWKSWLGRSPIAAWYSTTAASAILLYHHGVVFDRTDVERILKTQMEVCWNGDVENPEYFNVEGKPMKPGQRFLCQDLAPFSKKLASFAFGGTMQQERFDRRESPWQGGVIAMGYLQCKYLDLPRAVGGRRMYAEYGERFMADEANREFVEQHAFEVVEPGFQIPTTPQQMDPMPEAP
jgi:hypothetical protein